MKAVFSLRFTVVLCCILLDMLVLFGFGLWFLSEFVLLARAAGHASTVVNLSFPSLLGHLSVGLSVCF